MPKPEIENSLETPVLFLIFNRPDTTKVVFEAIRKARPKKLFVGADGPRKNKPGEAEKCAEARMIATEVDWPCEVHRLFRTENLGCGKAVSGAITWFFEHVQEGIILEDDTLPSPAFFKFCCELLERYRDDTRVMEISGSSLPSRLQKNYEYSYFFSNWDYIWGWATWRRAWKHYDYSMRYYPEVAKHGYFGDDYTSIHEHYFMKNVFERAYYKSEEVTWWSYQWGFARKINSGLVVVPVQNMVTNLGLGEGATNTRSGHWSFIRLEEMDFPLRHPEFVMHDRVTDNEVFRRYLTTPFSRCKSHIKQILSRIGLENFILRLYRLIMKK